MAILSQPETEKPQDKIFNILFNEDELTWQNIIYDLVKNEGMDPWDINIGLLSQKFLEMLKKLREMDFRISGKVVLASALLLKIKSNRLLEEDINALDNLINSVEDPTELLEELPLEYPSDKIKPDRPRLIPRTPQPRKRKVSVYDLVQALERALTVESRRPIIENNTPKTTAPIKTTDITEVIKEVYNRVNTHYEKTQEQLTFTQLIPSEEKEDKILTFIPLLHLENQEKVNMKQPSHFGEIFIRLNT